MNEGSYHVSSFAASTQSEIRRLNAQVDLFWHAESALLERHGLQPGMDYLDCGCGPGGLIERVREKFPGLRITGVEMDPILVEAAKERFRGMGAADVRVVQGTAEQPGLPESSFDFITMRLVLEHVPDPGKALRSLKALLKPGGRLFVVSNDFEYHTRTFPPVEELHDLYAAYRASRRKDGGDPCIGRRVPQLLREAGFRLISQDVEVAHSTLVGDQAFLRAEGVGIPAKLVEDGFLDQAVLDRMIKAWKEMLAHPDHGIMRQLFIAVGENSPVEAVSATPELRKTIAEVVVTARPVLGADTAVEGVVEELWCAALQVSDVDSRANFFDLGGTSMALMEVQEGLLATLGKDVPLAVLFQYPTIEGLVRYLTAEAVSNTPHSAPARSPAESVAASESDVEAQAERRRQALSRRKRSDID